MGNYNENNQPDIEPFADVIENAPYMFKDDFTLYAGAAKCKKCSCGGKCHGGGGSSPEESKLGKKVIELLEE